MSIATRSETNLPTTYDPQLYKTLRNSLYPGATDESIALVIDYCRHAKLDIMLKPVHLVPMYITDKKTGTSSYQDIVMPGINLYRINAARSGCAGISEPEFGEEVTECLGGEDVTYPKWCKVTVKRIIHGHIVEFTAKEYWKENYATKGKDKKTGMVSAAPNSMWKKRQYGQLAKCTEAQALRKSFPEVGAMPTAEEMEGKSLDAEAFDELQKQSKLSGKGVKGLSDHLGVPSHDADTGEIVDADFEPTPTQDKPVDKKEDLETIVFLLENSESEKELLDTMKRIKSLKKEEKERAFEVYKACSAKLKNK